MSINKDIIVTGIVIGIFKKLTLIRIRGISRISVEIKSLLNFERIENQLEMDN